MAVEVRRSMSAFLFGRWEGGVVGKRGDAVQCLLRGTEAIIDWWC